MTGIIRIPRGRSGKVTKPGAVAQARRAGYGSSGIGGPAGAAGVANRQALAVEQALSEQQELKKESQELQQHAQHNQQQLFDTGANSEALDSLPGDDALKDEYASAGTDTVDSSMLELDDGSGEGAEDGTDARTGSGGDIVGIVGLEDDNMNLTMDDEARDSEGSGNSGESGSSGDMGQSGHSRNDETSAYTADDDMDLDLTAAAAAAAAVAAVTDEADRSGTAGEEDDAGQADDMKGLPASEGILQRQQQEEDGQLPQQQPQPQPQSQAQLRHQMQQQQQQQQQQSLNTQGKPPTTAQMARDSGYYHLAIESALAKRLARERGLRLAQQRRPEQQLNLGRRSNVEALFAHIAGEEAAVPCKNCHKGHGPWTACVVVDGQMCGSCANCWFNASGARCSFHEAKTPIQAGHHLHTQRHHSSPMGPMVHHPVSAMSAAAAAAAPMVALDPHLVVPYGIVGGVGSGGGNGSNNSYGASISAIAHAAQIQAQAQAHQQQQQHSQHAAHTHLGLPLSASALPTPTSPPQPPSSVPATLSAMAAQSQVQPSPANVAVAAAAVANDLLRGNGSGGGGGGDSTNHSSSSTGDGSAAAAAAATGSQPFLGSGGLGFHLAAALMGGGGGAGIGTSNGPGTSDDVPKDSTALTTPLLSDASLVGLVIEQALAEVRQADARTRELMMVEIAAKQLAMAIVRYGESGGSGGGGGKQQQQQQQQQSSQSSETTDHSVSEGHQSSNGPGV